MPTLLESIQPALTAAVGAWDRGTLRIRDRAKELAPVRQVFEGQSRGVRFRLKSIDEIESDRAVRQRLGLGPENAYIYPPRVVTKRPPQFLRSRHVVAPNRLASSAAQDRLDRRGRYELKSARSVHNEQLGGRLRDEIFSIEARLEGAIIHSEIVSPTPYAKYQELGSRHNAAHPYLRPAAHQGQAPMAADVARSVLAVLSRVSERIEVTVPTRMIN